MRTEEKNCEAQEKSTTTSKQFICRFIFERHSAVGSPQKIFFDSTWRPYVTRQY
jgi:hypothetical protein